jgi:hypothetical protein
MQETSFLLSSKGQAPVRGGVSDDQFKAPSIFSSIRPSSSQGSVLASLCSPFAFLARLLLVIDRPYTGSWLTSGDLNALFALFMNTLTDLTLIVTVGALIGYSTDFMAITLIPSSCLAVFAGNYVFYRMAASETRRRGYCLATSSNQGLYRENRVATAIPFGVATPSLIQWLFNLMLPLSLKYSLDDAYGAALVANLLSGLLTLLCAFPLFANVCNWLPESASAAPLAGIGLGLLAMNFMFEVYASPLVAVLALLSTVVVFFVLEDDYTEKRAELRRRAEESADEDRVISEMPLLRRVSMHIRESFDDFLVSSFQKIRGLFSRHADAHAHPMRSVNPSEVGDSDSHEETYRWPISVPSALLIVVVFTGIAWILKTLGNDEFVPDNSPMHFGWNLRLYQPKALELLRSSRCWDLAFDNISIILPLTFVNTLGSLNCIKLAAKAGDVYSPSVCIFWLGVINVLSCLIGNPYGMTLYIGHETYKHTLKAGPTYSLLNGTLTGILGCLGLVVALLRIVPEQILIASLVIVGVSIMKSAFSFHEEAYASAPGAEPLPSNGGSHSGRHAVLSWLRDHELTFPAVIIGILPALANWALIIVNATLSAASMFSASQGGPALSLASVRPFFGSGLFIDGVLALSQGYLFTSILYASATSYCLRRQFGHGAICMLVLAGLAWTGFIHSVYWSSDGEPSVSIFSEVMPTSFSFVYLAAAVLLFFTMIIDRARYVVKTKVNSAFL